MTDPDVAYVLAALPYAGMEALRIAGWCTAAVAPAAAGVWLLARARRMARQLGSVMDAGDGQGGIPGHGHLRKVTGDADRKHLPVTIVMSLAELDAVNGPKLSDITGPDHVVTGQLAAAQDALTPRMVAPTRADLDAVEVAPRDWDGLGDLDPDWRLGGEHRG